MPLQDISPLESHHVAASFIAARENPEADIFCNMLADDKATLRASMIDLILGEAASLQAEAQFRQCDHSHQGLRPAIAVCMQTTTRLPALQYHIQNIACMEARKQ